MSKETTIEKDNNLTDIQAVEKKDFEFIFKKYQQMIFRKMLFYCNGDSEKAEDLTSDALLKVIENIDKYSPSGTFKSWIYKIAHNTFVDEVRNVERNPTKKTVSIDSLFKTDKGEEGEEKAKIQIADDNLIVIEEMTTQEDYENLKLALSKLSDFEQELIQMRYYDNMSWEAIAESVEENETKCRVTFLRSKKKLKKLLSR